MGIFGWDLPPGAAGDPNAPWNEKEPDLCSKCNGDGLVSDCCQAEVIVDSSDIEAPIETCIECEKECVALTCKPCNGTGVDEDAEQDRYDDAIEDRWERGREDD